MALLAYDPTRMTMVPVSQARVVAYVVDADTGKQYSTVAEAENDIAANRQIALASFRQGERESAPAQTPTPTTPAQEDVTEKTRVAVAQALAQAAATPKQAPAMGSVQRGENDSSEITPEMTAAERAAQLSAARKKAYFDAQAAAKGEKPTPPPADENYTYDYVWRQDVGGPGGKWVLVKTPIIKPITISSSGSVISSGGSGGTQTTTSTTSTSTSSVYGTPSLARDVFKNTLALFFGQSEMSKAWVNELYNIVSKFYLTGSTIDESFNLALQDARNNPNLAEFTKRFKGIYALQDLRQQGKPVTVPTIAEYVKTQSEMADLFTNTGLTDIATEDFTSELIGKGLSYSTISDRLVKVFDRIDRAPTVIKDTLSRYFPTVDRTKLAKTLLLGEKGVKQLQDELAGYEVLSAAEAQGIAATGVMPKIGGVTEERAKEYGALGETFETITPKFSQIAIATPRATQLAGFSKAEDIGQVGVEKAVISRSAKELQKLAELTGQEEARFAGKAGRAELGLASQRRANRAY